MKIKLIVDSVSDIPKELIAENNIRVVPLSVNFEDGIYKDGIDLSVEQFFEKLAKSDKMPTTSQVNPGEFISVFKEELIEYDILIVLTLSSKLSGTYSAAVTAKEYMENKNIIVIDSLGVSFGYGMIALEVANMIKENFSIEEIKKRIDYMILNTENIFLFDTLEFLQKGGRLSAAEAFFGTLLKVKPIVSIQDGSLLPLDKVRGRKKIGKWLVDYLKDNNFDLNGKTIGIYDALDEEFMNELIEIIKKEYPNVKFILSKVGSVVGTHSGPKAIGMSFVK
ncbi:MAG: DegV family protein [Acidaminobacteraceae bacterium]